MRLEILTVVKMLIVVCWVVKSYSYKRSVLTYSFYLQGGFASIHTESQPRRTQSTHVYTLPDFVKFLVN